MTDLALHPVTPELSEQQRALVALPAEGRLFLEGPAGAGKTTTGVARLFHLLNAGVPAHTVLVITPQRTLGAPYQEALHSPTVDAGGQVTLLTIGGLAQRMIDRFWLLVAREAGFAHPYQPPTFLTLETAQYYMARLIRPLLEEDDYFDGVTIDRNRLYSQIIDDLNKAAVVGFPYTEIGDRLKAAWGGEQSRKRIYEQAQICANRFRRYCLDHNLLDFSLQVEVFTKHLWTRPICRDYLLDRYTHLIVDNVEEDTPVAHDVVRAWLPSATSALLIYDREAGYRCFLGADPEGAYTLRELCDQHVTFSKSFVTSSNVQAFGARLTQGLGRARTKRQEEAIESGDARAALRYSYHRYYPEMLDWIADEIDALVHRKDVPPGEIVVLAPFLSDALRFSLANRLEQRGVPSRSHRPSRALRDEPATHCLLTLSAIAHPAWGITPGRFDVAYALMQAIEEMDLVRAQLLAQIVYRVQDGAPTLGSFDRIKPAMQERITFVLGERYEGLRAWIEAYVQEHGEAAAQDSRSTGAFDHFLSRLFGELLSQEGYGFHRDYDAGEVAANLIESVRKFRWAMESSVSSSADDNEPEEPEAPMSVRNLGQEYLEMVEDGVIAAQYIRSWRLEPEDAVLLAPAYTFIIRNRPVDYQFWLNVGGRGWWERLYQPLTHPYVLSRRWPRDAIWTDTDEVEAREEALYRLALGLVRRCRRAIYLGLSELGEQGYEQKGPLLQAIQRVLRTLPAESRE